MQMLKIFRAPEWQAFQESGRFDGSADDVRDGFIHLSTQAQLQGTLERHFASEAGLVIATLSVGSDPALRMEPSRDGALFPHLYRSLVQQDVAAWRFAE